MNSRRNFLLSMSSVCLASTIQPIRKALSEISDIDAKEFGVIPGKGDVTAALQRAIDHAAQEGKGVFIRANKRGKPYILRGTITVPERMSIKSVAAEAAEFRCFAKTAFVIMGARVTLYGLRFLSAHKAGGATAIRLATSVADIIELVSIKSCGARRFSYAVRDDVTTVRRMDSLHIDENAFQAMGEGGVGILLRNIAGSIYIRNNMVSFLRSAKTGIGYYIKGGGGVKFSSHAIGNFDEGARDKNIGAKFENCVALWLDGANIENFGGAGIIFNNCYAVRGSGNHTGANDGPAISIHNSTTVDLKTTTIRGNAASKGARHRSHGLHISGRSSEIAIDGIRITETTGDAVHVNKSAQLVRIEGLIVSKARSFARILGHGLVSHGNHITVNNANIDACNGFGVVAGGRFNGDAIHVTDCRSGRAKLLETGVSIRNWRTKNAGRPKTVSGPLTL
ncbi:MAG: hypothetical protein ABJO45_00080 [Lentilitoribacter sp.]